MGTSRPARVVFCLDSLAVGGTELNAVRLAERLDRRRFEVSIACFSSDGPLASRLHEAGVDVVWYPVGSVGSVRGLRQVMAFARALRSQGVALVHCHDRYANPFGVAAARLAGVPVIASKRWGESRLRHRLTNALAFRGASVVLANCPSVAASLERDDGVPQPRIVTLPNFLDDEAFQPVATPVRNRRRLELSVSPDDQVVGIVASLRPVKQHHLLLRAVAQLAPRFPRLVLVVVGDGESRAQLELLTGELGISERVRFAGFQPHSPDLQAIFDVAVLCSRTEGFPNSVLEAMAAARPVVATDVPGIRDAVLHEETGLLVPNGDPAALAGAIERILNDPALAGRLGERGRARARREYGASRVVGDVEALYERLMNRVQ